MTTNLSKDSDLPEPRRYFHSLPLGTAFRYIGGDDVWVVLETHGCGLIAKYEHYDSSKPLQQICSFEDSEYAAQHTEVDVVPLFAASPQLPVAQTVQAVWTDDMITAAHEALQINYPSVTRDTIVRVVNAGLKAAPPTQAIAVEAVQKPKIGERWFVKIKGSQTCHKLLVCDLTKKTISLCEEKPLIYSPIMRYVIADIELIEIAAPSQGAKQ